MRNVYIVLTAALLALTAMLFSVTYDLDNVYDLTATTSGLFTACVGPLDGLLGEQE
jgi:hypothetical protein